jgi:hypothetical protein
MNKSKTLQLYRALWQRIHNKYGEIFKTEPLKDGLCKYSYMHVIVILFLEGKSLVSPALKTFAMQLVKFMC